MLDSVKERCVRRVRELYIKAFTKNTKAVSDEVVVKRGKAIYNVFYNNTRICAIFRGVVKIPFQVLDDDEFVAILFKKK